MKMNKTMKSLTIAAALAVMIPISAYAATTTGTSTATPTTVEKNGAQHPVGKQGGFRGGQIVSQDVLDLLKLDAAAVKEQLAAGKTLAQIAEAQGVSRDALKQALTTAFDKRQAEEKQTFADNLDKSIDGQLPAGGGKGMGKGDGHFGGGIGFGKADYSAAAKLLGITEADLQTELKAGKSLADVAKAKGVDAQKLIDAQKQVIVDSANSAVKAGTITQDQADKTIANAESIAEKIVNGTAPQFGREGRGQGHKGGLRGGKADANGESADGTDSAATSSDASAVSGA